VPVRFGDNVQEKESRGIPAVIARLTGDSPRNRLRAQACIQVLMHLSVETGMIVSRCGS
jgi:hypothetical protein